MKIDNLLNRVDELLQMGEAVCLTQYYGFEGAEFEKYIDTGELAGFQSASLSFIGHVYGIEHIHYKTFLAITDGCHLHNATGGIAILRAIKPEIQNGFLTPIKNLIHADLFDNELDQAKELLAKGYKASAAIIAGVVLETCLRDLCLENKLPFDKLDKMNADLAKAGIYNKLQQKRITALADIRNNAAHGKPDEFTDADVTNMISEVEQFLANQLV